MLGIIRMLEEKTVATKKRSVYPKVFSKNPHIQSQAALILLCRKYGNYNRPYKPKWRVWLSFRNRFLKRMQRKGPLTCHYCNLSPLYKNSRITPYKYRATIDHVHPRSKGGKEFDEANLAVCCAKCNHKKSDKLLSDFRRSNYSITK